MLQTFKTLPKSVWIIVIAHAVTDLAPGALYVALPFLKAKFALTYAEVTAIVLMQNLTSSVTQPLFGYISDQKPRPWLMPVGCLVSGLVMLGSLVVPNYYLVLLCTAISGFGSSAFHPEAAKMINLLSGKAKGKGVSLFSVGGNMGFAFGSLFLAALLLGGASPRLYIYVVPCILTSAALFYVTTYLPCPEGKECGSLGTLKACVNWPLLALLGMVLSRATVASGISTFVPLYYVSYLQSTQLYASSLLTIYLGAGAVGTLLGGIMSDRYGSKQVMLYSILPIAVLLHFFKMVDGVSVFVVLGLASILLSATFTSSLVLAQRMMPRNIGMASGLTIGFSVGLGTMGVLALGRVADLWGIPVVFDILAFLPVVGFMLTLFVQEPAGDKVIGVNT